MTPFQERLESLGYRVHEGLDQLDVQLRMLELTARRVSFTCIPGLEHGRYALYEGPAIFDPDPQPEDTKAADPADPVVQAFREELLRRGVLVAGGAEAVFEAAFRMHLGTPWIDRTTGEERWIYVASLHPPLGLLFAWPDPRFTGMRRDELLRNFRPAADAPAEGRVRKVAGSK